MWPAICVRVDVATKLLLHLHLLSGPSLLRMENQHSILPLVIGSCLAGRTTG